MDNLNANLNPNQVNSAMFEIIIHYGALLEAQVPLFQFLKEKELLEEYKEFYLVSATQKRRNEQETTTFFTLLSYEANQKK